MYIVYILGVLDTIFQTMAAIIQNISSYDNSTEFCNETCRSPDQIYPTRPSPQTSFDDVLDGLEYANIVLLPTCLIAGVCGNLITILVINTKSFSKMGSRYFLVALATSDIALLLTQPFNKMFVIKHFGQDYRALSAIGCKIFFWFFRTGKMTSSWFVVYLCLERFTAIKFPFRVKTIFSRRNCFVGIVMVYVIIGGFNAGWTYCSKVKNGMCYPDLIDKTDPGEVTLYRNMLTAGSSLYSLIPIIILVTVTPVIIISLVRTSKRRRGLTQARGKDMDLMRATTMLVAVMVTYVLFVTPITALHNVAFYIGVNAFGENTKRFLIFRDVAQILEQLNYTINFFLYVCSSRQFRTGVSSLLQHKKITNQFRKLAFGSSPNVPSTKNTKLSKKEVEENVKHSNGEKAAISTVDSGDLVQENVSKQEGDTGDAIQPSLN